jgi:thiol-disulfide isomerase/thioredoxin
MFRKTFVLVLIALFLISCGKAGEEEAKQFNTEYDQTVVQLKDQRSKVATRDQYNAYNADKKKKFEDLLKKYEKAPNVEKIEVLRSKALLNLKNLDDAEKKIDAVLANDPEDTVAAKMVKVKILFAKKEYAEAEKTFKEIEANIKNPEDLFDAYYTISTEHKDGKVKEEYAAKYLNTENIPEAFAKKKADIYLNLALVAKENSDFDKARELLKQGVESTDDERTQNALKMTAEQLDYFGQEAFPITAPDWLNTEEPLDLANLKGKVVLVTFWAPWCPYCHTVTPALVDIYENNKDKDFTIIGFTRLYGSYRDNENDFGKVTKEEELDHIKNYLARNKINYPIAVANEKAVYGTYKVSGIPTLVFINKKGEIDYTDIGGANVQLIKDKVQKLLSETSHP